MEGSSPHSGLVEAIRLGIENYRRPGVGRDIDVYAHALLSLERLEEQLKAVRDALEWIERKTTDPSAEMRARNALSNPADGGRSYASSRITG